MEDDLRSEYDLKSLRVRSINTATGRIASSVTICFFTLSILTNVGWVEQSETQHQVSAIDINFGKYTESRLLCCTSEADRVFIKMFD
ncbi:MAG: hypothetical protein F6K31_24895 [Symploca sp. SIO2G7]|nr:hypothetical protein [Symploca sp. SIO2G7]